MRITPRGRRLIVRPHAPEGEVKKGALFIPTVALERPQEGTVVAAGPGAWDHGQYIATEIKVGDVVFYGKYAGLEVKLDEKTHLIMHEEDVLGVVAPEPETADSGCVSSSQAVFA